ncbi:MAG: tetratricopeptide repeat protein [Elusimicrobiota bacterium]|nr:tetratricopeptide repeat protein [Elusimicrobiota bacterium]
MLDASRRPERVDPLRWPSLLPEKDLTYMSRAWHDKALQALGRGFPWQAYWRGVVKRSVWAHGWDHPRPDAALAARLSRLEPARYGWMGLEDAKDLMSKGALRAALPRLRAAVASTEPGLWLAQCLHGEARVILGEVEAGLEDFDAALALAEGPSRGDVTAWKGEMLLWLGRDAEAAALLEEGARLGGQYAHAWLGGALLRLGRAEEALARLDHAVALSPRDAEARTWRCEALRALGRPREALAAADEALALDAASGPGFYLKVNRALALGESGDADASAEAVAALEGPELRGARRLLKLGKDAGPRELLEGVLRLSRGLRRDGYPSALWLKPKR